MTADEAWEALRTDLNGDDPGTYGDILDRHRPAIEAALTREPGLDVERLARAIAKACPWHLRNENVPCAPNVAREYAALAPDIGVGGHANTPVFLCNSYLPPFIP